MFSYFARSLSFFAVLAVVLIAGLTSVQASPYNHSAAKQAILIDFETGMILFEKNADEKMPTSSMSKVRRAGRGQKCDPRSHKERKFLS